MNDCTIPREHPRAGTAALLAKSLQLWNAYIVIATLCTGVALLNVLLILSGPSLLGLWWILFWLAMALPCAWFARACTRPRGRLQRVWRDGDLVEVTVIDWGQTRSWWYETVVEYEGRRAEVNLRRAPDRGMKLQALIHETSVAVLDPVGRLRIAWLGEISPRHS